MTNEEKSKFERLLDQEADKFLIIKQKTREGIMEATAGLSRRAFDDGEMADLNHRLAVNTGLCQSSDQILKKIDMAKQGIKNGTYGQCLNPLGNSACEISISLRRLEAVPWEDKCLSCQKEEERSASEEQFLKKEKRKVITGN